MNRTNRATYTLENVEQTMPHTIPRSIRDDVPIDAIVKLGFVVTDNPIFKSEWMWVIVTERLPDGRYSGELNSEPSVVDLYCGDSVTFGPEHIANIYERDDDPRPRLRLAA
jgi:hypothetical protein